MATSFTALSALTKPSSALFPGPIANGPLMLHAPSVAAISPLKDYDSAAASFSFDEPGFGVWTLVLRARIRPVRAST